MKPNPQLGKVTFLDGQGDLPAMEITTPWSRAEIYFHGAHVTQFQKHGEPPLLFLSQCSRFQSDAPIRGGIPIIFPWFGKPADKSGQHGIARIRDWELKEVVSPADGSVILRLKLSEQPELPGCALEYVVGVSDSLSAELLVANQSGQAVKFENCLHTYFTVGDINAVSVAGLKGVEYLDALESRKRTTETDEVICLNGEVDRIYVNSTQPIEIRDEALRRVIRVEKEHSQSSVVWNPWMAKAKAMPDYGDDEYQRMVCVESGNVAQNEITLPPGETSRLRVRLSSTALP